MSPAAVMSIVFFAFFFAGVAVGVLAVIAASVRRAHKAVDPAGPVAPPPGTWRQMPETGPDESGPDGPPWWHARGD
jgi:hypothetical protein